MNRARTASWPVTGLNKSRSSHLPLPFAFVAEIGLSRGGAIEGERAERMEVPHWYLMALGVDPERQGRGLGKALLELGLARADRSRHPVYLETFRERTARMYARFGFETVGRARVSCTGPPFTAMVRPLPSKRTGRIPTS